MPPAWAAARVPAALAAIPSLALVVAVTAGMGPAGPATAVAVPLVALRATSLAAPPAPPFPVSPSPATAAAEATAPDTAAAGEDVGPLYSVRWLASALGSQEAGGAAWLAGPQGALRLEIGIGSGAAAGLEDLLARRGRGWTVAVAPGGSTLLQPWHGPWREVAPAVGVALGRVLADIAGPPVAGPAAAAGTSLAEGSPGGPRQRPAWMSPRPRSVLILTVEAPSAADLAAAGDSGSAEPAASAWRRRLTERGLGAGGPGEVWTVRRWLQPQEGPVASISSSRLPGRVEVWPPREQEVRYPVPEAFLPVWPLGDLIEAAGGPAAGGR